VSLQIPPPFSFHLTAGSLTFHMAPCYENDFIISVTFQKNLQFQNIGPNPELLGLRNRTAVFQQIYVRTETQVMPFIAI